MYIDNMSHRWFSKQQSDQQSLQPLLEHDDPAVDDPAGILTQYVIDDKTIQQYISNIPEYNGRVIPTILRRKRTVGPFDSNYCYLESFLENFSKHHNGESWVLAGLLSETGMISAAPVVGQVISVMKLKKESKCKKQILCKKYGNKVVFLINVVDSNKLGLNNLFSNTIMIITPHPSASSSSRRPLPVVSYHVGVEQGEPIEPIGENIGLIRRRLSDTNIFVIDPNKLENNGVTVEWFGNMPLNAINDLIQRSKILSDSPPPPGTNIIIGGKSRYSKKRVTKRRKPTKHRKSTKRRHRRTTRKPT